MAEIDPRLNAIIGTALGSPLAPLVVRALARIEALDTQPRRIDEDHDPFAPVEEEVPEDRALRQLGLLDFVVARELKLELELMDRNGELIAELGNAIAEFRTGAAMSVVVLDPADADGRERRAPEDLLSGERRRAIEETLEAWRDAVENLGSAIRGTEA
ncbi:hypothetical protein [Sphingomonas oligophenolica]|uniref:Uncharacterized protein n=1 Tax=Sphingomonas oligophenolica TaxID=301154 RepID=A0A502CLN5_9SPHN|nr:hypothetical protein [Sphingomonas oligophenolica]TPG13534.1 hypothetical protein EAH84_04860 [Sphingomonas oligophenolica]